MDVHGVKEQTQEALTISGAPGDGQSLYVPGHMHVHRHLQHSYTHYDARKNAKALSALPGFLKLQVLEPALP